MDEKLSPLFPVDWEAGGGGAVVTNEWCITVSSFYCPFHVL